MTIDLSHMPTTLDIFHLILAILALSFFLLFLKKQNQSLKKQNQNQQTPNESTPLRNDESSNVSITAEKPAPAQLTQASPDAALQLLTLLQQDARFIDFVKEDLSAYSDADIGAAARVVHEGSQKTLNNYFTLESVRTEDEETRITLPAGFNAAEVRLTGNVVGEAPFTGTLIHKGWKVSETKLPKIAEGHDTSIVAMAEVEL